MAEQEKAGVCKPGDLSSIPRTHRNVEGQN